MLWLNSKSCRVRPGFKSRLPQPCCCVVLSHLVVSDSCDPWTVAHQAPLFMGVSRQEYWSGLPFPSPGDLHDPGIKSGSPALQVDSLPSEPLRKPPDSLWDNSDDQMTDISYFIMLCNIFRVVNKKKISNL